MNQLINVWQTERGNQAVNARDLYNFLESKRGFAHWMTDRIEKYDFVENKDYCKLYYDAFGNRLIINEGNSAQSDNQQVKIGKIEYVLTLNMAKELAMVENNEKGKEARKYFIDCEEKFRASKTEISIEKQIELEKYKAYTSLATLIVNAPNDKVKELLYSDFLNLGHGYNAAPVERKTYYATEISGMLKSRYGIEITKSLVGRLANKYDLKRSEWGVFQNYNSNGVNVSAFKYYEEVVEKLKDIITNQENKLNLNF